MQRKIEIMKLNDKTYFIAGIAFIIGLAIFLGGNLLLNTACCPAEERAAVSLPGKNKIPEKIVTVTPMGTELIYALGYGEKIVGVDIFSDYPPEAKQKPQIGSFFDTNFEAITAIGPDIIVTLGKSQHITDYCEQNNIQQLNLKLTNQESIYSDILYTGKVLGCSEKAEKLCNDIFTKINEIRKKAIELKADHNSKPTIFLCLSRKPGTLANMGTFGKGTCLDELIEVIGCENAFSDMGLPYGDISKESLIKRSPDIIIESVSEDMLNEKDRLNEEWKKLDIPATQNGKVYFVDQNIINRPGVRSPEIAQKLFECVYGSEGQEQ